MLDDNVVTIIEKWETVENLISHIKSPHMVQYQERVINMVENLTVKVLKKA